jgi:hypothetical protein
MLIKRKGITTEHEKQNINPYKHATIPPVFNAVSCYFKQIHIIKFCKGHTIILAAPPLYLGMVAAFIRGSTVMFTELPRWNGVSMFKPSPRKVGISKQQEFINN